MVILCRTVQKNARKPIGKVKRMIIDKVEPYWTEEEKELREKTRLQRIALIKETRARYPNIDEAPQEVLDTLPLLDGYAMDLIEEVQNRYIEDRNVNGLLEDAKEIVEAITREDFLEHINERKRHIATLIEDDVEEERLADLREMAKEDYNNCYSFILFHLRVQIKGLTENQAGTDKALAIVKKKVSQWYVNPQPTHFPIPYSKPTDALAFMSQKQAVIDQISGDATIDRFSVQLRIERFKDLKASLGVSTDKLLSTALSIFARNNDFSKKSNTASNRRVVIPLKEYAQLLGYNVEEKHSLDNARKKVKKDLEILYSLSFEWEEVIHGKVESFRSVRLLTAKDYKRGNISITFTPEIADHLVARGLITQYNAGMLKLDERKPNAYYIMRKLEEHYNMRTNQMNNRHDRIRISTILKVTDLPSYEDVAKKDRGHWERRIKDPLEEALDYLSSEGLLESWEYTHAKGVPLTDEEALDITDYKTFSDMYLRFTPADRVDQTDKIESNREEREKREKEKKKG